jgi:hypothetical protein
VTLLFDSKGIERAHELRTEETEQGWVADRIARYAETPIPKTEAPAPEVDAAVDGQVLAAGLSEDLVSASAEPIGESGSSEYVLFVPSAAGYVLIERDGDPPVRTATVELSDLPGRFEVVKLAQSPLPDDQRRCAHLHRID